MLRREHDRATTARDNAGDTAGSAGRDWRRQAACRDDGVDAEVFFPVAERGPELRAQEARAKAVCAGCPVIDACRAWALDALPEGVAGGLTAAERRRVRVGSARPMTRQTARHPGPARRSRGSWTSPQQRAAAVGQVEAGRSCAAVAAEFEVSDRTVARWRAAHTAAQSAATSGGAR